MTSEYVVWLKDVRMHDVDRVGGKNASLGELISQLSGAGVRVPGGFATTSQAYRDFLDQTGLKARIEAELAALNADDVDALAQAGARIRGWVMEQALPADLYSAIASAYVALEAESGGTANVAVRSSATAEDLPDASFAGQQETFLNISGLESVIEAIRHVFASLYNDRAISYRVHQGYAHSDVALSAGIQRMVRSDVGTSGVLFTLDTESGFDGVVFITAAYGLGESVVQGAVNPDEYYVAKQALLACKPAVISRTLGSKASKMIYGSAATAGRSTETVAVSPEDQARFCLNDAQLEELARYAVAIEQHYGRPMDVEWGLDGLDGKLYVLQARPETVASRKGAETLDRYRLKAQSEVLSTGRAIGNRIGQGVVRVIISTADMNQVQDGDV